MDKRNSRQSSATPETTKMAARPSTASTVGRPAETAAGENERNDVTVEQILAWADAYHAATGKWPKPGSGTVQAAPFSVTWGTVHLALKHGRRGLPGGSSLARVRAQHRQTRSTVVLEPLTEEQIVTWAEAHRAATGHWPEEREGQVQGAPYHLTWRMVDEALRGGQRGLPGGSSLRRLRARHDSERQGVTGDILRTEQILAWADAFYSAHGHWPNKRSGRVTGVPGESWNRIDAALGAGARGLPGGNSLWRLLSTRRQPARPRGPRSAAACTTFTTEQMLAWADAFHASHRRWPAVSSGPIPDRAHDTWESVDRALRMGFRGLPGGSSLPRLLAEHRGSGSTGP
jgi:hypothetical protein